MILVLGVWAFDSLISGWAGGRFGNVDQVSDRDRPSKRSFVARRAAQDQRRRHTDVLRRGGHIAASFLGRQHRHFLASALSAASAAGTITRAAVPPGTDFVLMEEVEIGRAHV